MGVQQPNSTNYQHPHEPNLLDLTTAMEYDADGKPHIRVTLGSDNITINGDVNIPTPLAVSQDTVPWQISKDTNANSDTNRIYVDTGLTIPPAFDGEIKNDTGNPIPISATTAANSSVNPIHITGAVTTAGGSAQGKLWFFQIAQGLIAGHIPVFKAGYNPSIANNTEESLWTHSVIYPWASWSTGGTLSCASTSASDTGTLTIVGLRASDWVEVTENITLTGTSPVVTTNSFIRINSAYYNKSTGPNVGEIDMNRNGTAVGTIAAGFGSAQMAQYTVPAGYTAYLINGRANLGKGNDGIGYFSYRIFGGSFQKAMTFLLFQSTFDYEFQAPLVLPEKTDLDVSLTASVSGTAATCAYSLILIQNGL